MILYLDSSILLARALDERNQLAAPKAGSRGIASELTRIECLRVMDRYRLSNRLTDHEFAIKVDALHHLFEGVEWIRVSPQILSRAAQPFPMAIRTLDAIHLMSAVSFRESGLGEPVFATHDAKLRDAALVMNFRVQG